MTARTALVGMLFLFSGAVFSQDDPIETRVYNVELLTRDIQDWPSAGEPGLGDVMEGAMTPSEGTRSFLTGEDVAALVKSNIAEDSWSNDGASIEFSEGTLTVTNRRSVNEAIGTYLAYLRGFFGRMVVMDGMLVMLDPELLSTVRSASPQAPAVLSPEQVGRIMEAVGKDKAEIVRSMRVTAYSGQRVAVEETVQHRFLRGHNVNLSAGVAVLDPVIDQYSVGAAVDVRPIIETFGNAVTLEVRGASGTFEGMEEKELKVCRVSLGAEADEKGNPVAGANANRASIVRAKIQHPRIAVDRFRTTVMVPERQTAVVGLTLHENRLLALLLTPSIVSVEEPAPEPAMEEGRRIRFYDVSALTREVQDFPGPRLDMPRGQMTGVAFAVSEGEGVRLSPESVIEMIRTHVAPDTWQNSRNTISASGGGVLMVRQKPEVLLEIDKYLAGLLPQRARMISTEAVLIGFREGARARWEKEIPALGAGGYFAEADQVAKLLADAAKGEKVRIIDRAEVTGYPQERVHAARFVEETYLSDYDPQLGALVGLFHPVISTLGTGFVLDVRPHFVSGTERIAVDLRSTYSSRQFRVLEDTSSETGYVQLPELTANTVNSSITCVGDKYTVASVKSRVEGGNVEEVVLLVRARVNAAK